MIFSFDKHFPRENNCSLVFLCLFPCVKGRSKWKREDGWEEGEDEGGKCGFSFFEKENVFLLWKLFSTIWRTIFHPLQTRPSGDQPIWYIWLCSHVYVIMWQRKTSKLAANNSKWNLELDIIEYLLVRIDMVVVKRISLYILQWI